MNFSISSSVNSAIMAASSLLMVSCFSLMCISSLLWGECAFPYRRSISYICFKRKILDIGFAFSVSTSCFKGAHFMAKKQTDGRYRAKITVGHTIEGLPVFKYVSGRTKRELEEAKQAAIMYYVDGTGLEKDRLFGEYAIEWYRTKKEPHLSASSREGYKNFFNVHILPAFGDRMMRAIRSVDLQSWINGYAGKSKTMVSMLISILRGVMSSAYAEGIIPRDPTAGLITPQFGQKEERRALTSDETAAVLKAISEHQDGLYLAVLYYLGLRRGEALGLQWGDFDFDDNTVHIQRDIDFSSNNRGILGELKTDCADRFVSIPAPLLKLLHPSRGLHASLLFPASDGSPLSYSSAQRLWISLMICAGLVEKVDRPEGSRPDIRNDWKPTITPHYLRHNYITMLYEAGIDPLVAMRLVGHSDYNTTASIYTHLREESLKRAAHDLEKVFSKKSCRKVARSGMRKAGEK